MSWAAEVGLRLAPQATGEGLGILANWVAAAVALDDLRCHMGFNSEPRDFLKLVLGLLYRVERPEAGPMEPDPHPLCGAFVGLSQRVRAHAPVEQWRSWVSALKNWLLGVTGESSLSVSDHLTLRTGAIRLTHVLIEVAEGTVLPAAVSAEPAVRAATDAAYALVLIGSDLYSPRRELAAGTAAPNLVGLLMPPGGTVEDGIEAAVRLHDRIMVFYTSMVGQLTSGDDEQMRRYFEQLGHYVRASLDASVASATSVKSVPGWALSPTDGSLTAPPIPAIAWWWDQLDRQS
ncbi:terpene synthase family protein [Streptomyces lydicus]|uniref:terpene synthase family protein n=1 Tax=Streptomyces lydicus TaxID=47763 RepID=UPI0037A5B03C